MTDKISEDGLPTDSDGLDIGEPQKKRRGRPSKGDPVLVRLAPSERSIAEEIGGGVVAEGIRLALIAAGQLGSQTVQLLVSDKAHKKQLGVGRGNKTEQDSERGGQS